MSDESEEKLAEVNKVKELDEFAKRKSQEQLARSLAFNSQVLGGVGINAAAYNTPNYIQQNAEMACAEAIYNLANILQGLARFDNKAIDKLRAQVKEAIKELL